MVGSGEVNSEEMHLYSEISDLVGRLCSSSTLGVRTAGSSTCALCGGCCQWPPSASLVSYVGGAPNIASQNCRRYLTGMLCTFISVDSSLNVNSETSNRGAAR